MSRARAGRTSAASGFPRVSGDEPSVTLGATAGAKFSPRERG